MSGTGAGAAGPRPGIERASLGLRAPPLLFNEFTGGRIGGAMRGTDPFDMAMKRASPGLYRLERIAG